MLKFFDVTTVIVGLLWPFAVVALAWWDAVQIEKREMSVAASIRRLTLLVLPLWAPVVYLHVCLIAEQIVQRDSTPPILGLGTYLLYSMPASWAVSLMIMTKAEPFPAIVLSPVAYAFGIFVMGIVGWATCGSLHVCSY